MAGWLPTSYDPSSGDGSFNPSWEDSFKTQLPDTSSSKPEAKDYLKGFSTALMEGLNARNRSAAQETMGGGFKSAESKGFGGSSSKGGMTDDLTIVHSPGAGYGPTFIPGTPGKPGFGGVIGRVAGTALGFAVPGLGPALGMGLGGALGDSF